MSEFEQLMEEIRKSRDKAHQSQYEMEWKFSDLQIEVTAAQEKASQKLAHKISKSSHQFQRKGHEKQFNFNASVQESITTAKGKLAKLTPARERRKRC